VLLAWSQVSDRLADEVAAVGVRGSSVSVTPWYVLALVAALLSVAACAAAFVLAPAWPEMGSRYDAPGATAVPEKAPEEQSSLDLWKAMDEGRDPTARDAEHPE
jgi:hypothetical protein